MTLAARLRKGWCPGALRPMPAEDGMLVRLRISGGALSSRALRRLAEAGRACGNGLFDLSSRANLQMRGVSAQSLPALTAILAELGLLDEDAEAEAVRNVLASPLVGLDAPIDAGPIAQALEKALVGNKDLHGLPGKFGFLIDDGGALSLASVPADVRFDYCAERKVFIVGVGGDACEAECLGACEPGAVVDQALRIARAFLDHGARMPETPRRMRELLQSCGPTAIAKATRLRPAPPPQKARSLAEPCPIGPIRLGGGENLCFGVGAPYGRFDADMLEAIARGAEAFADGETRLTPWRAMLLPGGAEAEIEALKTHFSMENFIIDPQDPRLAVAACPGAPACAQGSTPTHADALALAPLARLLQPEGVTLHVSGCAKGCARRAATPYALIAKDGRYELIVENAPPNRGAAQGLTLSEAQYMLESIARQARAAREVEHR
ncbi:precorrin-3B synthase [Methylocapsa acidiphila]|uniref:precorrin-3B synthase n=1 Tax=Methylocapsa acidiphila TaxID=133552 RepID=UPI000428B6A8|nr:precorrin-3B synthase [Methylocapsa acidiphila]